MLVETAEPSEIFLHSYQTTRCHVPEDSRWNLCSLPPESQIWPPVFSSVNIHVTSHWEVWTDFLHTFQLFWVIGHWRFWQITTRLKQCKRKIKIILLIITYWLYYTKTTYIHTLTSALRTSSSSVSLLCLDCVFLLPVSNKSSDLEPSERDKTLYTILYFVHWNIAWEQK